MNKKNEEIQKCCTKKANLSVIGFKSKDPYNGCHIRYISYISLTFFSNILPEAEYKPYF